MTTASSKKTAPVPEHDIFTDPALARSMTEDPLFKFLRVYWKPVLTTIGAAFAVWFIVNRFSETAALRQGEASDLFSRAAARVAALQDLQRSIDQKKSSKPDPAATPAAAGQETPLALWEKELSELEKKRSEQEAQVSEALAALSDAPSPYAELGQVYQGLAKRALGKSDEASGALLAGGFAAPEAKATKGLARSLKEFQELAAARALLDIPEKVSEGRAKMKAIAENSEFAQAAAAYSFVRTAKTAEERAEAQALLDSISSKNPEMGDLVAKALQQ